MSTAWCDGLDGELAALVRQKGWRSTSDVLGSYRNLEKLVGGDRLQVPERDAPPEAWARIWDQLGRPKDAAGYDFRAPDGHPYDAEAAGWFRETAHAAGLSLAQGRQIHDAFLERFAHAPQLAADEGNAPEAEQELRQLWGRRFESNMAAARRAFARFLGDEAPFHDIADAIGEPSLMQLLAKVGALTAEDSITARADASGSGPRNATEALLEIRRLQQAAGDDPGHPYVSRMHPDHAAAVRRMEALFSLAYGAGEAGSQGMTDPV
jgi:hypothetical protein